MPWPKISHIFETERPTNFKLGIRIDKNDPHRSMTCSWPQRSKVKVIRSRRQSDTCLPVTRQRKVAEILKLAGRLSMTRVTFSISSKVKRSRSSGRLTPWPKTSHICGTRRPMDFKLSIRIEYDDSHYYQHTRWPPTSKLKAVWVAVQCRPTWCGAPGPTRLRGSAAPDNN